jgi:hypothetical protein
MAGTRPNDLPCMDLGEVRLQTWIWSGIAGENNLDAVSFACSPTGGVTFDDSAAEGLTATVFATAAQTGCYTIIATGTLSSGETIKLKARQKISDPTQTIPVRDYE